MRLSTLLKTGTIALKRMNVALFLSKFSKRDFTVHQHLLMLAVKELEKETYRDLIDRLEDSKAVDELLNLRSIGTEGYVEVKEEEVLPRRGLRKRVAIFKRNHPEEWKSKYDRRLLIESSYHAMKAVTRDVGGHEPRGVTHLHPNTL